MDHPRVLHKPKSTGRVGVSLETQCGAHVKTKGKIWRDDESIFTLWTVNIHKWRSHICLHGYTQDTSYMVAIIRVQTHQVTSCVLYMMILPCSVYDWLMYTASGAFLSVLVSLGHSDLQRKMCCYTDKFTAMSSYHVLKCCFSFNNDSWNVVLTQNSLSSYVGSLR